MIPIQDTWAPDALQVELKLTDLATVRNGLFFWNNLGVVKSITTSSSSSVGDSDLWTLIEEQTEGGGVETDQVAHGEFLSSSCCFSVTRSRAWYGGSVNGELTIFWKYSH